MASTVTEELATTPPKKTFFDGPFRTPVSQMGRAAWAAYRFKWTFGHRFIGENSWAWRMKKRLGYQRWVLSHVRGWPGLVLWRLGIRVPFKAVVGGKTYEVRDAAQKRELSLQLRRTHHPFPFQEEVLGKNVGTFRVRFGGRDLRFSYARDRFGPMVILTECFVYEYFAGLDVAGQMVIDVGCSVGDTPAYFAVRGAKKVVAFEPYPATYERAKENIEANGLNDTVTLLNEGGGASGWMRLSRGDTNLWANAMPAADGEPVRFNSLREIIERFGVDSGVLKYHGEGSEYEFFGDASVEDLRRFSQIAMKYHYGGKPIIRKLKSAGFEIVREWDLHFSYNASSSNPRYEAGLILAKRVDHASA